MDKVNIARGNGSVKYFKDKLREIGDNDTLKIIDNMDLYPSDDLYDSFVVEEMRSGNRVVYLKEDKIEEINKFFESNEEKIWESFLDDLYKFEAEKIEFNIYI